jgi:sugar lactone lactonase YvrE
MAAFPPSGELYFCDATEGRILRFDGTKELVVYQHIGSIKHLAFGPSGRLFFSSVMGTRNGGTIFELSDSKALPYHTVKPEDLPQGWAGTFAFDRSGMLWLSSGSGRPAALYRVRAQQLEQVYTASSGGVLGFSFLQDGSIVYADGAHSVYRVTLPSLHAEKIFDSPFEGMLTDVKPARPALQARTKE